MQTNLLLEWLKLTEKGRQRLLRTFRPPCIATMKTTYYMFYPNTRWIVKALFWKTQRKALASGSTITIIYDSGSPKQCRLTVALHFQLQSYSHPPTANLELPASVLCVSIDCGRKPDGLYKVDLDLGAVSFWLYCTSPPVCGSLRICSDDGRLDPASCTWDVCGCV